ncbi:hypothetical protein BH23BAC3_BH23BAC3_00810 [soil metagenome]
MDWHRLFTCGLILMLIAGCTTSKWTVVDEHAVNPIESPDIVSETELLIADEMPSVEQPVLKLSPYKIIQSEYAERIKIQRTVQEYQPKWGFALLAVAGSALSFTAANTDIFLSGQSDTQRIALNATGALLGILAATNMRESGEPIPTDEIRYLRQTGIEFKTDTVFALQTINQTASITITHEGTEIFHDSSVLLINNAVEINLGALTAEYSNAIRQDDELIVTTEFKGGQTVTPIPVNAFMEARFVIEEAIAQVRSSPSISSGNILTELAEGSSLQHPEEYDDQWIKVEYDSQDAFVLKSFGSVQLRSTAESGPAVLVELTDIPFGEIDVENSLPVLKNRNPDDRAVLISGNRKNQTGFRQYAERGERLFRHYMKTSLRMTEEQIIETDDTDLSTWLSDLQFCRDLTGGSTIVYLTGFAREISYEDQDKYAVYHVDEDGNEQSVPVSNIFEELTQCNAEKLFLFVDLEYIDQVDEGQFVPLRNVNGGRQQQMANVLLRDFPNAFVLFGNRIGQQSSIYSGSAGDDKRHHIFPYFLAEALKQRNTQMSALFRHLENNVDYTSRRLHDRPQEVLGFGNFMLDIAQ